MMNTRLTMVYWKSKKFWLGKLMEHPEIMTQGRTLKELEKNIRDAYRIMNPRTNQVLVGTKSKEPT